MSPLQDPDDGALQEREERQENYLGVSTGTKSQDEPVALGNPWPEYLGGREPVRLCVWIHDVYTSWSFSYMNPILRKGKRQFKDGHHLGLDDLYDVPEDMRSEYLVQRFWEYYKEKDSLLAALWKIAAPNFIPAGVWELCYVLVRVSLPLSLRELLLVIQANPGESIIRQGLPYAITLSLAAVLASLSQNRVAFLSTKSGICIRAALTSAIYEHALRLTPAGRVGLTAGEVTNLVAVDTQKLFDVMVEGHNLWSCPLLIVVVSTLLWVIMGPELLVGVGVLILFVPVIQRIVSRMLQIRKARSKLTDTRINILTSMLQGIRVAKLNHYESKISELVGAVREQEMKLLRSELFMWGWVLTCAVCSPLIALATSFSFFVLVSESNFVTPADAFSVLLLFAILRFPINMTARLVGKMGQALEAVARISSFFAREIRPLEQTPQQKSSRELDPNDERPVVELKNGCFSITPQDDVLTVLGEDSFHNSDTELEDEDEQKRSLQPTFTLRDLSLQVLRSQVVAVVGTVGSGKTLLLRALLGEVPSMPSSGTELSISGTVSYAAQAPFIVNTTLRNNVLFGSDYNEDRYEKTLDACCLRPDMHRLGPAGDLTQIGERGVTLSGGQKQRVALARAVYAKSDVALLDDIFSALDSNTASMVFDGLFGSDGDGMLRSSGTILVTHAVQFLPRVDLIVVMSDGSPSFIGTWSELQQLEGDPHDVISSIKASNHGDGDERKRKGPGGNVRKEGMREKDGIIMTTEEREYGVASLRVWIMWLHNAGGWGYVALQFIFLVLDRGLFVASDWWIARWSEAVDNPINVGGKIFPPQTDGRSAQAQYVLVYNAIIILSIIATALRSQWAVAGGARCAEKMFLLMTDRVLRAPLSYFETTPLGRILNRFTYDVEVLDIELSVSMAGIMIAASWFVASIIVMATVLPWIIIGLVPVSLAYFFIQLYYRMTGPDLQRIDAMSRSPIQANLAEGLEGSTTIRAFRVERKFAASFRMKVDKNSSAMLNFLSSQRWLGLRIELLGSSVTFLVCLIIVCFNGTLKINPGLVGLVVQWSVVFSAALNFFFIRLSESEAKITSIERIHQTSSLPMEAAWETDPSMSLDPSWPKTGALEFDHVCMRYRKDLPLALDSVSFKLGPGTRCGVVGRTGSGKTSLTTSLFRLVEIESGSIVLDGIDLTKIGLSDVRGRSNGMRIIPQDPVLFAGTLRDCLDPFQTEDDSKLLEALQAVNHNGAKDRGLDVLNDKIDEGGSNYSVGERQLLCLARAIVEEPRVLVLDEATASVDSATDGFIQKMLRTSFRETTLVTIAHRLNTIMDYDVVLVMDEGRAAEFGPPKVLLQDDNGIFTSLVEATGAETASYLRSIADNKSSS